MRENEKSPEKARKTKKKRESQEKNVEKPKQKR
jgi:hypothetical protein